MPTLPLYDADASPDAWHHVRAPGGYEWWHFDATGLVDGGAWCVAVDFFDGDPFSEAYHRAYARYRRRPTRVAPPVPSEYPCVRAAASGPQWDKSLKLAVSFDPGSFKATDAGRAISIGLHGARPEPDGAIRVFITELVPPPEGIVGVSMDLLFQPKADAATRSDQFSSDRNTATHAWSSDAFSVTGSVMVVRRGEVSRVVNVSGGLGRRLHVFGTGPITDDVKARLRGWIDNLADY